MDALVLERQDKPPLGCSSFLVDRGPGALRRLAGLELGGCGGRRGRRIDEGRQARKGGARLVSDERSTFAAQRFGQRVIDTGSVRILADGNLDQPALDESRQLARRHSGAGGSVLRLGGLQVKEKLDAPGFFQATNVDRSQAAAPKQAISQKSEESFDERMTGSEVLDLLALDRRVAPEGPDQHLILRQRDAGQRLDGQLSSEIERDLKSFHVLVRVDPDPYLLRQFGHRFLEALVEVPG